MKKDHCGLTRSAGACIVHEAGPIPKALLTRAPGRDAAMEEVA